jgi:5-deoxy-5-amino-3-dehydroquinate synthase
VIQVDVPVPGATYPVHIGAGAAQVLEKVLLDLDPGRVAIVSHKGLPFRVRTSFPSKRFDIPEGEARKDLSTVRSLCSRWARWGLSRGDVVVAVGGGLVTDTAGFAAASYHRGVRVVHVPTTLLGMVDAAIGGKTGVNLPEGKNLVGAFWQPSAVICDLDALATLPERELRSGRGELAKYHFLTGADLLGLDLDARVAEAVRIKAAVIAADEREDPSNLRGRATLNYGHTLGHALETAGRYDLRHGEAVAIGLVYAAELAQRLGRIDADRVEAHRDVVRSYGLPIALPERSDPTELVTLMHRDQKAIDGLTFELDGPDGVEPVRVDDRAVLLDTFTSITG